MKPSGFACDNKLVDCGCPGDMLFMPLAGFELLVASVLCCAILGVLSRIQCLRPGSTALIKHRVFALTLMPCNLVVKEIQHQG